LIVMLLLLPAAHRNAQQQYVTTTELTKQLGQRMNRASFEEFRLKEAAKEAAVRKTQKTLAKLLRRRQSKQRLQQLGVIKEGTATLSAQREALVAKRRRIKVAALLAKRPLRAQIEGSAVAPSLKQAEALAKQRADTSSTLGKFLQTRPQRDNAAVAAIAPSLEAKTERAKTRKVARSKLGKFIVTRPQRNDVDGIVLTAKAVSLQQAQRIAACGSLDSFFAKQQEEQKKAAVAAAASSTSSEHKQHPQPQKTTSAKTTANVALDKQRPAALEVKDHQPLASAAQDMAALALSANNPKSPMSPK
jgi:hypothetical protein